MMWNSLKCAHEEMTPQTCTYSLSKNTSCELLSPYTCQRWQFHVLDAKSMAGSILRGACQTGQIRGQRRVLRHVDICGGCHVSFRTTTRKPAFAYLKWDEEMTKLWVRDKCLRITCWRPRAMNCCTWNRQQVALLSLLLTSSPFWILLFELMIILCPLSKVTTSATQLGAQEWLIYLQDKSETEHENNKEFSPLKILMTFLLMY